jgi:hypothetical protein
MDGEVTLATQEDQIESVRGAVSPVMVCVER